MYIIKTIAKAKDRIIEEAIMYVKNETIAKKFCDEYNRYNVLLNDDADYYEEASYEKIIPIEYEDLVFSTFARVIIRIEAHIIYIDFEISHGFNNKYPYCEEKLYSGEYNNIFWFYLRIKSEESLHELKSRCKYKAAELIKKDKGCMYLIDRLHMNGLLDQMIIRFNSKRKRPFELETEDHAKLICDKYDNIDARKDD